MLFNFRLLPLHEIKPWGRPHEKKLHWFGLTDGEYWIQTDREKLFEFAGVNPSYLNYQVVRLYEDVLEIVAGALEPVPPDVSPYLNLQRWKEWTTAAEAWLDIAEQEMTLERYWEAYESAYLFIGDRELICGHLSMPPRIRFWSDEESVYIEWDTVDRLIDGLPVWTAGSGSYRLRKTDFVQELHAFHNSLMEQMGERVRQVLAGALPPDIEIHLWDLEMEHEQRSRPITQQQLQPRKATDWTRVRYAIEQLKQHGLGSA